MSSSVAALSCSSLGTQPACSVNWLESHNSSVASSAGFARVEKASLQLWKRTRSSAFAIPAYCPENHHVCATRSKLQSWCCSIPTRMLSSTSAMLSAFVRSLNRTSWSNRMTGQLDPRLRSLRMASTSLGTCGTRQATVDPATQSTQVMYNRARGKS